MPLKVNTLHPLPPMNILYLTVSYRLRNKEPVDRKHRQSSSNLHDAEENVISVESFSRMFPAH